jgi:protein CMS1
MLCGMSAYVQDLGTMKLTIYTRALRSFQSKDNIVGKLFAKHIKLEEAKQFLTRARSGIGAGTPTRVSDLIESGK